MLHTSHTISQAVRALRRGEPIVFPTDTLYGLGVSIEHASDPDVLYRIKRRDERKPIAWLIADVDDLTRYGRAVPDFARALARTFWPGSLTLIVRASDEVPAAFRSQAGTIGLRMPDNPTALSLIRELGCPVATTSANVSGRKNALSFDALDEEVLSQVACALNDDERKSGVASTVVDCASGDHPVLMREGALTIAQIMARC